jgi:hypothetical protein
VKEVKNLTPLTCYKIIRCQKTVDPTDRNRDQTSLSMKCKNTTKTVQSRGLRGALHYAEISIAMHMLSHYTRRWCTEITTVEGAHSIEPHRPSAQGSQLQPRTGLQKVGHTNAPPVPLKKRECPRKSTSAASFGLARYRRASKEYLGCGEVVQVILVVFKN